MTAHTAPARTARQNTLSLSAIADAATYWAGIAAVYLAYGFLWFYAAKEKLIDQSGTMPAGLAKSYSGTIVDSFPGVNATWVLLGLVEAVAFLAVVGSLLAGEFLPQRRKPILGAALAISMFAFALMIFGQDVIGNSEGIAPLFSYLGVTAVVLALLRFVPPFRGPKDA